MPVDLLNIGRTGVNASHKQMDVAGNNISNVNTDGYHRQVATQGSNQTHMVGGEFYGTGAFISNVKRIYDKHVTQEFRAGLSTSQEAKVKFEQLNYLDETFSLTGRSVPAAFNELYAGLASLADLPSDRSIRTDVLISAEHLADEFNQMQALLFEKFNQINAQIGAVVDEINMIGNALAELNIEMIKHSDDMEVLDSQDKLVRDLSQYIDVSVIETGTGAKDILVGGSVMLVSGDHSFSLDAVAGDPHNDEIGLIVKSQNMSNYVKTDHIGGQLGGLFDFRDNSLTDVQLELDHLAIGVAYQFNKMQGEGFDINGAVGQKIFSDINANYMQKGRIAAYSNNRGNANLTIEVTDPTILSTTSLEYELHFTAPGTFELVDPQQGTRQTLNLAGNELVGTDGFKLNIVGTMQDQDVIVIRPSSGSAAGISMLLNDSDDVAAAGYKITPDQNNIGNTTLKLNNVSNRNANIFPVTGRELMIQINSVANTYEIFDVNGNSFGVNNIVNSRINAFGFELDVSFGNNNSVERFTLDFSFAKGDNTNALKMSQLNESKIMENGTSTFIDMYQSNKLAIGRKLNTADIRYQSSKTLFDHAEQKLDEISSVNLDEEAANLMRYQQSYQASARVINVAQQIFESLIDSLR